RCGGGFCPVATIPCEWRANYPVAPVAYAPALEFPATDATIARLPCAPGRQTHAVRCDPTSSLPETVWRFATSPDRDQAGGPSLPRSTGFSAAAPVAAGFPH